MTSHILQELEESERVFEGLLASLSDISCVESGDNLWTESSGDMWQGEDSGTSGEMWRGSCTSSGSSRYPGQSSNSSSRQPGGEGDVVDDPPSKIRYDYNAENNFEEIRSFNPSSESSNSNNVSEPEAPEGPSHRVIQSTNTAHTVGSYSPSGYESLARGYPETGLPRCNPYKKQNVRGTPESRGTPDSRRTPESTSRSTPESRRTHSPYTRSHLDTLEHQLSERRAGVSERREGMSERREGMSDSRTTSSSSVLDESNAYFESGPMSPKSPHLTPPAHLTSQASTSRSNVATRNPPSTSSPARADPHSLSRSSSAPGNGQQCQDHPNNQTSFYKGRVMDKLSLPEQSGPEWVDGRCNNCNSTEDQLRAGAVNIVKDLENPLTVVLKGLKSQHIPSGYRSDSVLGPSSKKSNRANDKISNLHKSTENLKSSHHVNLGTFGAPNGPMYANLPKHNALLTMNSTQSVSTNSSNPSNHCSSNPSNHCYTTNANSNPGNQCTSNVISAPDSSQQITANLNTSHPKDESSAVKMASNVDAPPWHGPEPSITIPSAIPNRTITESATLPPVAPKRSESSRFSSRLKRKKETKSAPATPEPTKTGNVNNSGFFAKASQMFRKRKKERPLTYAELMRLFAPPPPPALLRSYHTDSNLNDNYQYNVHIGMRVLPHPHSKESILTVDETKCHVLIANETLHFDYVHGIGAKQVDVCNSMLSNVLPSVLHGRTVVCVAFGRNVAGRQFSLIGSRDSTQCLGLMPTAVTWLNKLNDEDRSKCGPNLINITSLRLDESKTLSEFLPPVSLTKVEELGKYLDKLTLTLPAREHPNEEVLIITLQFGKAKTKKNKKEVYGSLTFVDVGTPIRKNDCGSPIWDWLHEITNSRGENNKYPESFLNLRHSLMLNQAHVVALGHITPSPKDYQAIGITLNLATRLYMRHLPPHRRSQIQRLKKEKDYSSATSTGEESADTVIYRPGGVSDGEGVPRKSLPERTKGDGQEQSPQFKCGKQQYRNHSDTEDRMLRNARQPRLRGGYHSDGGQLHTPRTTSTGFDRSTTSQPSRSRQYALTDSEDIMKYSASPRIRHKGQSLTDSEGVRPSPLATEPKRQRQAKSSGQSPEDIRQKRVQKNQQQLKRYFELLRQQHQREKLLQQSREMQERGVSSPDLEAEREGPAKEAPNVVPVEEAKVDNVAPVQVPADVNKENEEVMFRARTKSESRSKGDNRRLYTIYDTEDDGAVLNQFLDDGDHRSRKDRSGYKSDNTRGGCKSDGGLSKSNKDKSEISREWLSKIKKKRHMPPNGQVIDYGIIDFNDKPQVKESKRVKGSLSEDELITRGHHEKCQSLTNKQFRHSERRSEQRVPRAGGYSTDNAEPRPQKSSRSGYQSDGARSHRHRSQRNNNVQQEAMKYIEEVTLGELYEQVQEVELLVTHRMQWRGNAVADLDYFDQQIRILERRNALIENLRRKQFELLSELKATKAHLMSGDWKPDLKVDSSMNENSPGYLSALWNETKTLELRVNSCKSKLLVETSFM